MEVKERSNEKDWGKRENREGLRTSFGSTELGKRILRSKLGLYIDVL